MGKKDSILIIDDDAVILKFMKIVLEMEGYECGTAVHYRRFIGVSRQINV